MYYSNLMPKPNNATPRMNIYGLKRQLYKCTEANSPKSRNLKACQTCQHRNSDNCWQRLMLDAAHAITLLLDERDRGKTLIVEGDADEV